MDSEDGVSINSSNSHAESVNRGKQKIKPGFLDKPKSHVMVKLRWPHMNQNQSYITTAL